MFFPLPYTWKMVKDTPNHFPMNIIGLAQTSRKILEDYDILIFPVVLSTPDSLQLNYDCTGIPLSTFCVEIKTICIWPYVQFHCATQALVWIFHPSSNDVQPSLCLPSSPQLWIHGHGRSNGFFPGYLQLVLVNEESCCIFLYDDGTCSVSKRAHGRKLFSRKTKNLEFLTWRVIIYLGQVIVHRHDNFCIFRIFIEINIEGGILKSSLKGIYIANGISFEVQKKFIAGIWFGQYRRFLITTPS